MRFSRNVMEKIILYKNSVFYSFSWNKENFLVFPQTKLYMGKSTTCKAKDEFQLYSCEVSAEHNFQLQSVLMRQLTNRPSINNVPSRNKLQVLLWPVKASKAAHQTVSLSRTESRQLISVPVKSNEEMKLSFQNPKMIPRPAFETVKTSLIIPRGINKFKREFFRALK